MSRPTLREPVVRRPSSVGASWPCLATPIGTLPASMGQYFTFRRRSVDKGAPQPRQVILTSISC
jgi:hypothetical protein